MATIQRIEKRNTITFADAAVGNYFEWEDDLFIKITEVKECDDDDDLNRFNAICLNRNGILVEFDYNDEIIPVNDDSVIIKYELKG